MIKSIVKKILHALHILPNISGGHEVITRTEAESLHFDHQWQDPSLPKKQYEIVQKQLSDIRNTQTIPPHMNVLVEEIRALQLPRPSVLEIGCSSGYYSEVFACAGLTVQYNGCDYSDSFIALAKELYPACAFTVADGTSLPYSNNQFDIAISGCCILHMLDYPKAIAETARVAKQYAIFHRTPVVMQRETTYTKKQGYGVPMIEIFFQEAELLRLFAQNRLELVRTDVIDTNAELPGIKESTFTKNYVCKKK